MGYACVYARGSVGINAPLVNVEVHLSSGLPSFSIVGLPEKALRESKERVRSAIINSQFHFPMRRITVNLAPADLPKQGGRFDLAIAIGILLASHQLKVHNIDQYEFAAELALDGEVRPVTSLLAFAMATQQAGRQLIVAAQNATECQLISRLTAFKAKQFVDVCQHLRGEIKLPSVTSTNTATPVTYAKDLSQVKGQQQAKRALEIAAVGGHSILFYGPPGTGKTMLAERLITILPLLNESAALEVAALYSHAQGFFDTKQWRQRPFRAPHHSASSAAIVGGGKNADPGEISLAHQGVLFLDELPEFNRAVLEALREPLQSAEITVARVNAKCKYPAKFQLVAAMNPCPCGFYGDRKKACVCAQDKVQRYRNKISGPLWDRIDLQIAMPRLTAQQVLQSANEETSVAVRERVSAAQQFLTTQRIQPPATVLNLLAKAADKLDLSLRAQAQILGVATTIAALDHMVGVNASHLSEALALRVVG